MVALYAHRVVSPGPRRANRPHLIEVLFTLLALSAVSAPGCAEDRPAVHLGDRCDEDDPCGAGMCIQNTCLLPAGEDA